MAGSLLFSSGSDRLGGFLLGGGGGWGISSGDIGRSGSGGIGYWGGGRGIGGLLVFVGVLGESIDNLNADLLGEGQLDGLTGRGGQLSDALLKGLGHILNLGDGDALLLGQVFARDSGQGDGLVDAGLDWLGVGDLNGGLDNGDNGNVVACLLGDLLAVIVAVASISVSVGGWLAHGDHLGDALLLEGNFNSLCGGGLRLGLIGVGADLIVNLLDGLSADGSCDGVALLTVDDSLADQLNRAADSLESGGAHFGGLNDILDCAVVLGVFVGGGMVVGGCGVISRGGMVSGSSVISWGGMVSGSSSVVGGSGVMDRGAVAGGVENVGGGGVMDRGADIASHQRNKSEHCKSLKKTNRNFITIKTNSLIYWILLSLFKKMFFNV